MTRVLLLLCLVSCVASAAPRASVWAGTSLAYGYSHDATPAAARLEALWGTPVDNSGVGSDRLSSIILRWQTHFKAGPYRRLIAEGGTNDIYFDAATGADLWDDFRAWIEEAQAARWQVCIITIPPRWGSFGWTADMETERLAFNALAIAYQAAHPSLRIVNSDTTLGTGSPVALQAGFNSGDALHLNGTGMQALAEAVDDAF